MLSFVSGHGIDCSSSSQDKQKEWGKEDDEYDDESQAAGTIQCIIFTLVIFQFYTCKISNQHL